MLSAETSYASKVAKAVSIAIAPTYAAPVFTSML
jgi:hypothetical protein